MAIKARVGSVTVELSGDLERQIRAAIDRAAPMLVPRIEAETQRLADEAVRRWPVDEHPRRKFSPRPHSRDLFESGLYVDVNRGIIRGTISNRARYWVYITSTQVGLALGTGEAKKSAIVELLRKPLKLTAARLAPEFAQMIAQSITKG